MKKTILSFLTIILLTNLTTASIVDTTTAKNTARNFIYEKININDKANYENIDLQFIKTENRCKRFVQNGLLLTDDC